MRLLFQLVALVAIGGVSVIARATSSLHLRSSATDVCGNVNAQLTVTGLNGKPVPVGPIGEFTIIEAAVCCC